MTLNDNMSPSFETMKNLQPKEAYAWLQAHPDALFVDVRMEIESLYVGRPPGGINVPWYDYPDLQPDAQRFAETVSNEASGKDQPLLLIAALANAPLRRVRRWPMLVLPTCSMWCMALKASWTSISSALTSRVGVLTACPGSKCRLRRMLAPVQIKTAKKLKSN